MLFIFLSLFYTDSFLVKLEALTEACDRQFGIILQLIY